MSEPVTLLVPFELGEPGLMRALESVVERYIADEHALENPAAGDSPDLRARSARQAVSRAVGWLASKYGGVPTK